MAQLQSTGITGSLTVTGNITAQEFHTEYVSSSILHESGSTSFGNTSDDVHNFTGSLNVLGPISAVGAGISDFERVHINNLQSWSAQDLGSASSGSIAFRINGRAGATNDFIVHSNGTTNYTMQVVGNAVTHGQLHINPFGGRVGINTSSPTAALDVAGAVQLGDNSTTPNVGYGMFGYSGIGLGISSGASGATQGIGFWLHNGTASYEAGRWLSGGNLGIGTTAPTSRLHVVGQDVTFYSGTGDQSLQVGRGANERLELYVGDVVNKITAYNDADGNSAHSFILNRAFGGSGANDFIIQKDGTAQITVNTDGEVGVGTSSPQSKIDIRSTSQTEFAGANSSAAGANFLLLKSQGDTARTLMSGPSIVFATPANSDGSNVWATSRLLGSPGPAGSANGAFSIQVRSNYDPFSDGTSWNWRTALTAIQSGKIGLGGITNPSALLDLPGEEDLFQGFKIKFSGAYNSGLSTIDQGSGAGIMIGANVRVNNGGSVVADSTARGTSGIHFDGWSTNTMGFFTSAGTTAAPLATTERMRITGTGDVFIGGNLSTHHNYGGKTLGVRGTRATLSLISSGTLSTIAMSANAVTNKDVHLNHSGTDGSLTFYQYSNGGVSMVLDGNGKLGIGTSSPNTKLDVHGTIAAKVGTNGTYTTGVLEISANGTPTQIKITTNIPYSGASASTHAHSVTIKGFQYGSAQTANIQIGWHVYNNSFYNRTATSSGAWAPDITLAVENNLVVIHLATPGYWPKMYVESMYNAYGGSNQAAGWTWADAAISADANTPNESVNYKANFGNNFVMATDGDVGIGTGTPGRKLHVNSGTTNVTSTFESTDGTAAIEFKDPSGTAEIGNSGNSLIVMPAGVTRMLINDTGNVGIGTTTPVGRLQINGNGNSWTDGPSIRLWDYTNGKGWLVGNINNYTAGDFYIRTMPSISGSPGVANNEFIIKHATGNLGLGTSSPAGKLEISQQLSGASTIDYPVVITSRDDGNSINQAGGEGVGIKFRIAGNASTTPGDSMVGASIAAIREEGGDTDSSTGLGFFVSQNNETLDEAVRIDHNGSVGIGVTPFAHSLGTSVNLDLLGNGGIWGYAGATYVNSNAYYSSGWKYKSTNPAAVLQVGGSSQNLTFRQAASGTAGDAITFTQPFMINSSGYVGISTSSPAGSLHVFSGTSERLLVGGDVSIKGATDLQIDGTSRRVSFNAGTGTVRTSTANSLYLATNNTTALTINSNQDATFAQDLTVNGNFTFNGGNVQGNVAYTVDMGDTSTFAENTFYPVTIPVSVGRETELRIEVPLNSGDSPSYATHGSGVSLYIKWSTTGNGWGTTYEHRTLYEWRERYTSATLVGGITQMTNGSIEVIYLRGGTKYYFYANRAGLTITPRSATYTNNSQSVSPTTSVVNDPRDAARGNFAAQSMRASSLISGVVGVGTTSPAYPIHGFKTNTTSRTTTTDILALGSSHASVGYNGFGTAIVDYRRTYQESNPHVINRIKFIERGDSGNNWGGAIQFQTKTLSSGTAAPVTRMSIDHNGWVGIGTTSPAHKLEVTGGIKLSTANSRIFFGNAGSTDRRALEGNVDGTLLQVGEGYSKTTLYGFVGIGTTVPAAKLDVAGKTIIGVVNARSTNALTVGYSSADTFTADTDITDANRTLSIVNDTNDTTDTYSSLGFRLSPTTNTSMGDLKFVRTAANENSLIWTTRHGSAFYDRFTIKSNGFVGIGTTNPGEELEVNGEIEARKGIRLGTAAANNGTTTLLMRNYDSTLVDAGDIQGRIQMTGRYWSGSTSQLVESRIEHGHQIGDGNGGSFLQFLTQTGGAGPAVHMRIDRDGQVGIGTTSPDSNLAVVSPSTDGNSIFKFGTSSTMTHAGTKEHKAIVGTATSGAWYSIGAIEDSRSAIITIKTAAHSGATLVVNRGYGQSSHSHFQVLSSTTNANGGYACITAVRIHGGGLVDIKLGWSSGPNVEVELSVYGNGFNFADDLRISSGGTGTYPYNVLDEYSFEAGSGHMRIHDKILTGGDIKAGGDVIAYASSDRNFKDNLVKIETPLDKINKLSGYYFNWNDSQTSYEAGTRDIGVVAQEVEEVIPEIVNTRKDGHKAVRYEKMVALLLEGIKEQQGTIEQLKDRIKKLESK